MKRETIRPLEKRDLAAVALLDGPLFAALQHHGDYALENTAALWQEKALLGVGCLKRHGSWHVPRERGLLRKITLSLHTPTDLSEDEEERRRSLLVNALRRRFSEIAADQPAGQATLQAYVDAEDGPVLQLLVEKGFFFSAVLPVMGRELDSPLPEAALPEGLRIVELPLDETGLARYLAADARAYREGIPTSPEEVRALPRRKDFHCFVALAGDEVVGSVSTWGAEDGRGETERVFVTPEWQRRGVAKALLCHALRGLREAGYRLATLTVRGTNQGAMALYTSLGYTLRFLLVEMLCLPESGRKQGSRARIYKG